MASQFNLRLQLSEVKYGSILAWSFSPPLFPPYDCSALILSSRLYHTAVHVVYTVYPGLAQLEQGHLFGTCSALLPLPWVGQLPWAVLVQVGASPLVPPTAWFNCSVHSVLFFSLQLSAFSFMLSLKAGPQSAPHISRFIPGCSWSHQVGKYEFATLWLFLYKNVLIHGGCLSLAFDVFQTVSVFWFLICLWARLSTNIGQICLSGTWKGSLEKALQVIYSALAAFTFGLKSDNFPPDLQHSKAHPLYDSRRAKELAGCRSECYKTDVISGLHQGWEAEYSSPITTSKVGHKIAVLWASCACSIWLSIASWKFQCWEALLRYE